MSYLLAAATLTAAAIGAVPLLRRHRRRTRLYRKLADDREETIAGHAPRIATAGEPAALHAAFLHEPIVRIGGFLAAETLTRLQAESSANRPLAERSYIPGHKKGGTLSYETIHRRAPGCLALYHSPDLWRWLSELVGEQLQPTADHDQSSCSLLYYDRPGDHIGWHYDHNFYRGRHFTVLVSLVNRSAVGGVSAGRLQRRRDGQVSEVDTSENSLVIFEGARIRHRATAIADGDERVMLSMTFSTDPRIGRFRDIVRRIKDTAYYGPRALVD